MDSMETALLRKEVLPWDMAMPSPARAGKHHQHLQSPLSSSSAEEDTPCAAIDQSSLLWEDFSVDDLLDFGVQEEQTGGEHEAVEEADEEEERDGCSNPKTSSSALSFPAAPSSSDPIVPAGDAEELEWVSRFVDDSYSEFTSAAMTPPLVDHQAAPARVAAAKTEAPEARRARLTGPTKRPWRRSCFSMESVAVPAKTRSKRLRTDGRVWSSFRRPSLLSESSSSLCSSASSTISCSGSSITSYLLFDKLGGGGGEDADGCLHGLGEGPNSFNQLRLSHPQVKKKKGRKPKPLAGAAAATAGGRGSAEQLARRRCSHCGVDKTPQWRAGPMGAKTLCNACGVRYKSGRLLPEYRPACSPTFLTHVHSNSHRRVLEIRSNKELVAAAAPVPPSASCSPSPPQPEAATRPYGVV